MHLAWWSLLYTTDWNDLTRWPASLWNPGWPSKPRAVTMLVGMGRLAMNLASSCINVGPRCIWLNMSGGRCAKLTQDSRWQGGRLTLF